MRTGAANQVAARAGAPFSIIICLPDARYYSVFTFFWTLIKRVCFPKMVASAQVSLKFVFKIKRHNKALGARLAIEALRWLIYIPPGLGRESQELYRRAGGLLHSREKLQRLLLFLKSLSSLIDVTVE